MPSPGRTSPPNAPIPLHPSFLRARGRDETESALKRIVRSVKFELIERENAFRLLGPEMSYHGVDPYLPGALKTFDRDMTLADVLAYRSSTEHFDLCFEDSWTGYFIAKRFREQRERGDLVLIHLDDHTDMMPTLLSRSGDTLVDPTSGATFDPTSSRDWEAAIYSGAINIGNFITPLFFSGSTVHVRHIDNSEGCDHELCHVSHESCHYELVPDKRFAAIGKSSSARKETVGTYLAGSSPDAVLDGAPRGWTLVHIDLDYFINDFDGASRGEHYTPDPVLRTEARQKMDRFFDSLGRLIATVDGWLIATSPGFCSAYHWDWLLTEIRRKIRAFKAARTGSI